MALLLFACDGRATRADAATAAPADAGSADAGSADAGLADAALADASVADASAESLDAGARDSGAAPPVDAGRDAGPAPARDAGPPPAPDAGTPPRADHHVHIEVDNFCRMTVTPMEITVPPDQTAYFDWHNHSADYPVDVWMSYGGGFLELLPGRTWDEPIGHCSTPLAHDEHADISTACSSFRFLIHCL
ncbi:MAG: hypothetical protein IT378_17555 [Sandaracinaceae bacterium]|nr:hypothetical protein [Sandaracinaceae bacterium]